MAVEEVRCDPPLPYVGMPTPLRRCPAPAHQVRIETRIRAPRTWVPAALCHPDLIRPARAPAGCCMGGRIKSGHDKGGVQGAAHEHRHLRPQKLSLRVSVRGDKRDPAMTWVGASAPAPAPRDHHVVADLDHAVCPQMLVPGAARAVAAAVGGAGDAVLEGGVAVDDPRPGGRAGGASGTQRPSALLQA